MYDVGAINIQKMREDIDNWAVQNLDNDLIQWRHTGTSLLYDKNAFLLRKSLFRGLDLAFIVISLLMGLLFRSVRMVVIALIPNIFPLLAGAAIIGFSGMELDAPTAIFFTIAFGIAVDDTIHFLSKFRHEIRKGRSREEAILRTYRETCTAIMMTTVILFFGFISLVGSAYPPTAHIGLLISFTLLAALFADLFLLPICLYLLYKPSKKVSQQADSQ
jgi:predicted RND superfamily exporter protein